MNDYGQLGLGNTNNRSLLTPLDMTNVPNGLKIKQISCGTAHTIVLFEDSIGNTYLYGCGKNNYGQLGSNNTTNLSILTQMIYMPSGLKAKVVSCSENFTVVLFEDNFGVTTIYGCGNNSNGQLADGTTTNRLVLTEALSSDSLSLSGALNINSLSLTGAMGGGGSGPLSNVTDLVGTSPSTFPTAPIYVSSQGNDGSITVIFDTPTNNGGSAITNYYYSLDGAALPGTSFIPLTNGSHLSLTISGLTNGTTHSVQLYAENSNGYNYILNVSNLVPSTIANAPTGLSASGTNGSATISFTPPSSNGGSSITNYAYSLDGGTTFTSLTTATTTSPITITGLTNSTTYNIKIAAVNIQGNGTPSSAISVYITPPPLFNVCFPKHTPVVTDQGIIYIENINPNIHTIRKKKIIAITKTVTPDSYLVSFQKNSLGTNLPSKETIMSKHHSILYKGKLIEAKNFLNKFENVNKVKYTGETLYNVLMENHEKMIINNLICETLNPTNGMAKLQKKILGLTQEEQGELINKCNEYARAANVFTPKPLNK